MIRLFHVDFKVPSIVLRSNSTQFDQYRGGAPMGDLRAPHSAPTGGAPGAGIR